jgi:hypothetical protein
LSRQWTYPGNAYQLFVGAAGDFDREALRMVQRPHRLGILAQREVAFGPEHYVIGLEAIAPQ